MLYPVGPPFSAAPTRSPLTATNIHVWRLQTSETSPRAVSAHGHAALHELLNYYTGSTQAIAIGHGAHGKPHALHPGSPHFSISHTGGLILLAFASAQELGVDIERTTRERPVITLAERFFTAAEAAALVRLPTAERLHAFSALWTCKEAVLKAVGRGLAFGLDRLEFTLDSSGQPRCLSHIADEAGQVAEWRIQRLQPAPGHVAALAWRGAPRAVHCFDWPDG